MTYSRPLFALLPGTPDGAAHPQTVHDLGVVQVPSGRLEASDPCAGLGEGLVIDVPPGAYPVFATVVDFSDAHDGSDPIEACLSVVVSDAAPVAEVRLFTPEGAGPAGAEGYHGVSVDSGTVAFADAAAIASYMPPAAANDWYNDVFAPALTDVPDHFPNGAGNVTMPLARAGENVVLSLSGWGDGLFPLLTTHAADGSLLGVHIDLLVVGPPFEEDEEYDVNDEPLTAEDPDEDPDEDEAVAAAPGAA
jgi:hypothetical protein